MISRYEVRGRSMSPYLKEGDRVLLLKTKRVKENDTVVFSTADKDCIKRVVSVSGDCLFVEGDNKGESTDSRHFGPIGKDRIVGKVLLKY